MVVAYAAEMITLHTIFYKSYCCQCHVECKTVANSIIVFVCQAATKKQKYEKISEKKMSTPVEVLCKVRTF